MQENTDTTGGTRYSSGKPSPVWLPTAGVPVIVDFLAEQGPITAHTDDGIMLDAFKLYCRALDSVTPQGLMVNLGAHLMVLCASKGDLLAGLNQGACGPDAGMYEVAKVSDMGAKKYAPYDWALGQSYQTLFGSLGRHIIKARAFGPGSRDPESGLLHVAHALWNVLAYLHFELHGQGDRLDNVSCWRGVSATMRQAFGLSLASDPTIVRSCLMASAGHEVGDNDLAGHEDDLARALDDEQLGLMREVL